MMVEAPRMNGANYRGVDFEFENRSRPEARNSLAHVSCARGSDLLFLVPLYAVQNHTVERAFEANLSIIRGYCSPKAETNPYVSFV